MLRSVHYSAEKHQEIRDRIQALTDSEKGYMAGIIDGEGSITLSVRHPSHSSTNKTVWMVPVVTISNTDKNLPDWFSEKLGGAGSVHVGRGRNSETLARFKQTYHWRTTSPKIIHDLLETLAPLMIVKRKQASLMLDYLQNRKLWNSGRLEWNLQYKKWFAELNHRGPI